LKTPKKIAILGSTGSIGTQALEVIRSHRDRFSPVLLTAHSNVNLLIEQSLEFRPEIVVIGQESQYSILKEALSGTGIQVLAGQRALSEAVAGSDATFVLTALVGFAGLEPTISALKAGKDIGLANKETLVVAGAMITEMATKYGCKIIPVDSEHSAIFQCLIGEEEESIEKIILTASGGPFRGFSIEQLKSVSREQALKHPNWSMGAKITIDSATMMNKGLEVIEARWLFGIEADNIEIVVHPQSIVHSLVQFKDGSIKAQLGLPDMKLPIQYAMAYPDRVENSFPRFNFLQYPNLTFEQPDFQVFKTLELAYSALKIGGNASCSLNGANEAVVDLFLKDKVHFSNISNCIEEAMSKVDFHPEPGIEELVETDRLARIAVSEASKFFI